MLVGLCLLSTAPLAGQPSPEAMKAEIANPWGVEFTRTTGEWSRIFGHPSREACEAAIPQVLAKQSGYNGHCVYHDLIFFFSSRRRHTRLQGDWSSDVCSSDLPAQDPATTAAAGVPYFLASAG